MDVLRLDAELPDSGGDSLLAVALDGWTDAGSGGSLAAAALMEQWDAQRLGEFHPDALFDYRDRRPLLGIEGGKLQRGEWPDTTLWRLQPPGGPTVLLVSGAEPDLRWQSVLADCVELAQRAGAKRYLGLGSVPGPIPHTRPVRVISTSSDDAVLERIGRPHDRVIVPASCQVMIEKALGDAGLTTLGLWARIPHYVAGEYPAAAVALLQTVARELQVGLDVTSLEQAATENRAKLDDAAGSSPEITAHLRQLEEAYDAEVAAGGDTRPGNALGLTGPLPTGDQIAAELERFLREQS